MTKIGFNVLAWSANVSEDLYPIIERLKSIGYDGVEYFVGAEEIKNYKLVGDRSKEIGLEVTCVTVVSPDANPVSENKIIRQKGLDRVKWAIDRTHELGSSILCGPFHSAHAHFYGRPATADEL